MTTVSTNEVIVPSNPADLKKIKDMMHLISGLLTGIEASRSTINEDLKALAEEFSLPVKFLRKMAKTYHKQTINAELQEMEDFERLYSQVLGNN